VSVRVIVDKEGKVLVATADDPGPSRYFERLAIHASKKWIFAPMDSEERRIMLVRFNFTQAGTTARAPLDLSLRPFLKAVSTKPQVDALTPAQALPVEGGETQWTQDKH
jgi:hypothetical protein